MKNWLKNVFQLQEKLLLLASVDRCPKKMEENGFHLPENQLHLLKHDLSVKIGL